MIVIPFTARFLAVRCNPHAPQSPYKLGGHGMAGSRVFLAWSKELGYDYIYTLTVRSGTRIIQRHNGTYGFGNAKAFVVNGLIPDTQYTFEVSHSCTSNPTLFSSGTLTYVSTLFNGKDYYCKHCLTVIFSTIFIFLYC